MNPPRRPGWAFTLVEILVSMSVLTLMVVFIASIVNAVNRSWNAGEIQVENYQNGRAILDLVSRDLAPALASGTAAAFNPGNTTGAVWGTLQTVQNPNVTALLPSGTTQIANSDSLFWQAPSTTNSFGNVSELGYILVKVAAAGAPTRYQLQRFYAAQDTRYPTPSPTPAPSGRTFQIYDWPISYSTVPWLTNMSLTRFAACFSPLSDGVLGFWIRLLDKNGNPVPWLKDATGYSAASPMKFNSAAAFGAFTATPSATPGFLYTDPTATLAANRLPSAAELTIVTVDGRTIKRLGGNLPAPPSSTVPANVPNDINAYLTTLLNSKIKGAQVFSATVKLNNGTD